MAANAMPTGTRASGAGVVSVAGGDVGRSGQARSGLGRAAGLAFGALVLAGCGLIGGDDDAPPPPSPCPRVGSLADVDSVSVFAPTAPQPVNEALVMRAAVRELYGECRFEDGAVAVDLTMTILAVKGPAAPEAGTLPLQYFVAVVDPQNEPLAKEVFNTSITFEPLDPQAGTFQELTQVIPLPGGEDTARDYRIAVGFQLTPAQLEYNRAR